MKTYLNYPFIDNKKTTEKCFLTWYTETKQRAENGFLLYIHNII